jgi:histidine triad (HIT) family protein
MSYDPYNIFAKILRGEAACYKVYEDADDIVFMALCPKSPGHA